MYRDGFFSVGEWIGIEGAARALLRTPGGHHYWQHGKLITDIQYGFLNFSNITSAYSAGTDLFSPL